MTAVSVFCVVSCIALPPGKTKKYANALKPRDVFACSAVITVKCLARLNHCIEIYNAMLLRAMINSTCLENLNLCKLRCHRLRPLTKFEVRYNQTATDQHEQEHAAFA